MIEEKKLVLVTGAGGFIGSHLTERLLKDGYKVRAFVHYNGRNHWGWLEEVIRSWNGVHTESTTFGVRYRTDTINGWLEIIPGNIENPFFVESVVMGCSIVFHLAALISVPYSYIAPASFVATNVQGTLNILEACRHCEVKRLVHTSTSAVYGTAQYTPIDERHPVVGQSPYAASKIGADHLVESYYRVFGLPVSIARPFNTYGMRQSSRAVIPTIIVQALNAVPEIRLGALTPVRDFTFVEDTVDGFLKVASSAAAIGRVINIGHGQGINIGELAEMILSICGSSAAIVAENERFRPEDSEVMALICDNGFATKFIGWRPAHSLRQGLTKTIRWIRQNLHHYKPDTYQR